MQGNRGVYRPRKFRKMEGLRTSILLFTALLVGSNVHSTNGLCTRMFFAQPVVYDKAMGIGFYFTGINVPSVSACAEYCGKKSFCRTAIFNSYRKTCAISYEYTLNCRYNKNRYTDFDLRHSSSHLIQIACVTKCGGDHAPSMSVRMPVIGTLSKRTSHQLPDSLKKKDVISGKPHDGSSRELVPFEESSGVTAASTWRGYRADYNKVDIAALPITDELNRGYIRGRSQVCFRTIERRYLLGGSFERHTTSSIDECRCLCADTFSAFRLHRCQSLQWYHSGECVLNKDSHLGRYDLIEDKSSIYQYITCDVQVLIDIASKVCRNVGAFKFPRETPAPARTMSTTDRPPLTTYRSQNAEVPTISWNFLRTSSIRSQQSLATTSTDPTTSKENILNEPTSAESGSAETTKPTNPAEVTETSTTRAEAREKIEPSGVEVVGSSLRSRGHENATESSVLKIVNDGCFEEISGYMMTNVAGGLEHDVSVEECKCLCANSKTHRRYSFECLSATYYHEERDCILNLDDRHQNPHRLKKSSGYAVTYLAMTCGKEEISSSSVNVSLDAYCQGATIPPHPPTTTTPKKQKMEVNSDKCFLELPNFVLEGTALAIETEISHQECKCRCLVGESRYGEACQSFQYYFDSNTCLINKQNRFSNPESFNFVPSSFKRSYFEHRCATRDDIRTKYLASSCSVHSVRAENNTADNEFKKNRVPMQKSRSHDSDHKIGNKEATMTSNLKFRNTEGDEFVEARDSEKTEPPPPKWNTDNRTSGRYGGHHKVQSKAEWRFAIPEAESEEEGSSSKKSTSTAPLTITTEQRKMKGYVTPDDFVGDPSEFVPPQNAEHIDVRYPSRVPGVESLKYGTKRKKWEKVEISTTTTTTTTATSSTVTSSDSSSESEEESVLAYPSVGRCTYSAMYQTAFQGTKMIRSIYVKSPADCFAACYAHSCRSANLISSGVMNTCELYRDSIIDYRGTGQITYDSSTVYFDGIQCKGP